MDRQLEVLPDTATARATVRTHCTARNFWEYALAYQCSLLDVHVCFIASLCDSNNLWTVFVVPVIGTSLMTTMKLWLQYL